MSLQLLNWIRSVPGLNLLEKKIFNVCLSPPIGSVSGLYLLEQQRLTSAFLLQLVQYLDFTY